MCVRVCVSIYRTQPLSRAVILAYLTTPYVTAISSAPYHVTQSLDPLRGETSRSISRTRNQIRERPPRPGQRPRVARCFL